MHGLRGMRSACCLAGLTVKYFPLWLYERVGMSPVGLNVVQASMPLCVAGASLLATRAAAAVGERHQLPSAAEWTSLQLSIVKRPALITLTAQASTWTV